MEGGQTRTAGEPVGWRGWASQPRAARLVVAYIFFANGAIGGNWVTRIPVLKERLGLSNTMLGFAFFAAPLASILAMPVASWLVTRFGSCRTTRFAFPLWCAGVIPIAFAPNLIVLWAVIFVLGAISAVMGVAMNAHGLTVERAYGRPILSSFHACYSLGGLTGAGMGALAAHFSLDLRIHIPAVTGVALVIGLALGSRLLSSARETPEKHRFFVKPPRQLLVLGYIAFASMLAEGAIGDWSAVYINKSLRATATVAAFGYFGYSLMMVTGRYFGDRLSGRFGPVALTRAGGLLAAGSLATALLIGDPLAAIIGFAGVGAGLAAVIPTVYRAAGSHPGVAPGTGLAAVAGVGSMGFLVGPALIGSSAHAVGLPTALGIVAFFMVAIGLLGGSASPARAAASQEAPIAGEDARIF
jgi:MFS family permease